MQLTEKVVAITGAGSGIGRALAQKLIARGNRLALADVNEAGLRKTLELLPRNGHRVTAHVVDVSNRLAMHEFAEEVVRQHGGADVVINNAGVALMETVESVKYEDFEWVVGINFWGVVHGTKAFLPQLRKRPEAAIVNISSVAGLTGLPIQAAYSATKFAVRGFTEAIRLELVGSPIRVFCVHAGGVKTKIVEHARYYRNPDRFDAPPDQAAAAERFQTKYALTTAEQAASRIVSSLEKGNLRILIGWDARIIDWFSRFFPSLCPKLIAYYARRQGS